MTIQHPVLGPPQDVPGEQHVDLQRWLEGIAEIAAAVNRPVSLASLLDLVAETACRLMGYDFCGVLLPDTERGVLVIEGAYGLSPEYIAGVNADHPVVLRPDDPLQAPSSRAFATQQSVQVSDISSDPAFQPWGGVAREQGFGSMIAVPLLVSGHAVGTLNCYRTDVHVFGEEETNLLAMLADQAGIAIATSRLRAHEARTIADLRQLNSSLEEQHALLQQGEQIHQQLTAVALRAGGVQGVAQALADLLDRPVVVDEPAGEPLASVERRGVAVDAPDEEARGAEPVLSALADPSPAGGMVEVAAWESARTPGPRVMSPVLLGGQVVARIWVPGRLRDLGALDRRAVEQAATVTAMELLRTRTALEVEWRLSGELVSDLLQANPTAMATITSRARRLGHDLTRPHAVLVAKGDPAGPADVQRMLGVARSFAEPVRPRPLVTAMGDYVVVLWPAAARTGSDPAGGADAIRRAVARADAGATASVAVTTPCATLQDYPSAFRIARGAVELAQLRGGRDATVTLEDLGIYGLLLQLGDAGELVRFADQVLRPLRDYDAARGTALLETLAAYLRHDLNTAATAASLYVHPNTVGLRIRRAEELLGLSLASVEALAEVKVALMADEVVGFTPAPVGSPA